MEPRSSGRNVTPQISSIARQQRGYCCAHGMRQGANACATRYHDTTNHYSATDHYPATNNNATANYYYATTGAADL